MKSYYHRSKSLANSFLFILPLLVLYEVGIAMQGSGIKNTADVVIKTPLLLFGKNGSLIFNLLVIAFLFVSVFYEEIVFRLLLVTVLYFVFTKLLKIKKPLSAIASVLIGALIFTSVHYIGPLKDSFTYASFTFRLLAGLVLSAIFMFRGLGVVVYTHAIYDVLTVLKPFHI